ncbi:MAG: hypothetical protein RDV48_17205 [Candidatus Eremiobacteraeota bacterium]|nr:hypothetical protein [Candidatus Eremiobacteraeota bacterium]
MKKTMTWGARAAVFCLAAILLFSLGAMWAKEGGLKITVNNAPSEITPLESGGTLLVPLSFPIEEGKSTWTVTMEYDKAKGTLNIQKTLYKEKLRGDTKCQRCDGTGKCQACYPAGSGKNAVGNPCYICDGTGKCFYCNGEGKY